MTTRRVVLWRHGRTAWNLAGRVQGQSDVPLDEVGREQARLAARQLAVLRPSIIVSSDLMRARDTALELGALTHVEVEFDDRFREMNFGAREGLTWSEAWEKFPDGMKAWVSGDETQIPGSETHRQAGDRFVDGVNHHAKRLGHDEVMVIVAHGALLRAGTCAFFDFPEHQWRSLGALGNCSWSVLEESSHDSWSAWRLTEWNAGTLPEPVLSDDEAPGLEEPSATS